MDCQENIGKEKLSTFRVWYSLVHWYTTFVRKVYILVVRF